LFFRSLYCEVDTAGNGAEKPLGVFARFSQLSSTELKELPPADYQICLELYKTLNSKKIKGQKKDDAKDTILRTMSHKVREFNVQFEAAFLDGAYFSCFCSPFDAVYRQHINSQLLLFQVLFVSIVRIAI